MVSAGSVKLLVRNFSSLLVSASESHVVQLAVDGAQARFDVAQALAIGQLGEGHGEVLIPAGQILQVAIPA